ncbi:tryptophan--tRNA ligase [Streptomyces tremellae]|uniref:Tryptophan--tRNA ligase n=1 Tax=Streptomyces tremellae TaxID=1124239 RepID=A0ABP7FK84_9ACTN
MDLHALTVEHEPARVRAVSRRTATLLLAAGLDPQVCTLFVQSHGDEHTRLSYLLEYVATEGELRRMIQYREKSARARESGEGVRFSLLSYPALMAADILAYRTDEVPVGEDQRQHVEPARGLAVRFNQRYGPVFTVPRAIAPRVAARVTDLQDPTGKMGKSHAEAAGTIHLLDDLDTVRRKVMRAVTGSGRDVVYDRAARPGPANLLDVLAACRADLAAGAGSRGGGDGSDPAALAASYDSYGALKRDVADAVVEVVRPFQERYARLAADPGAVDAVLRAGAGRPRAVARPVVDAAYAAVGLLPAA